MRHTDATGTDYYEIPSPTDTPWTTGTRGVTLSPSAVGLAHLRGAVGTVIGWGVDAIDYDWHLNQAIALINAEGPVVEFKAPESAGPTEVHFFPGQSMALLR